MNAFMGYVLLGMMILVSGCGKSEKNEAVAQTASEAKVGATASNAPNTIHLLLSEGPLGLYSGMPLSELRDLIPSLAQGPRPYEFISSTTPKPHPDFSTYLFQVAPETGLCRIFAITPEIETNDFGDQIKSRHEKLKAQLSEKYGTPKMIDGLKSGSIWRERNEFTRALQKQERFLVAFWKNGENGIQLPHDLSEIGLQAQADTPRKGNIVLIYYFNNLAKCEEVRKKAEQGSL